MFMAKQRSRQAAGCLQNVFLEHDFIKRVRRRKGEVLESHIEDGIVPNCKEREQEKRERMTWTFSSWSNTMMWIHCKSMRRANTCANNMITKLTPDTPVLQREGMNDKRIATYTHGTFNFARFKTDSKSICKENCCTGVVSTAYALLISRSIIPCRHEAKSYNDCRHNEYHSVFRREWHYTVTCMKWNIIYNHLTDAAQKFLNTRLGNTGVRLRNCTEVPEGGQRTVISKGTC